MANARKSLAQNFQSTHLIYGLQKHRELVKRAMQTIAGTYPENKASYPVPIIVDRMNNLITALNKDMKMSAWLKDEKLQRPSDICTDVSSFHLRKHFNAIASCTFAPEIGLLNPITKPNRKSLSDYILRIRNACRAATVTYHVHFLLPDLDILQVFDEKFSLGKPQKEGEGRKCFYDSTTSAELRFILRHYEVTSTTVKFYILDPNLEKEITRLTKLESPDPDRATYRDQYIKSGKAYLERDILTFLACRDLTILQREYKGQKEGPILSWMRNENKHKRLTDSTLNKYCQKLTEMTPNFIASPLKESIKSSVVDDTLDDVPDPDLDEKGDMLLSDKPQPALSKEAATNQNSFFNSSSSAPTATATPMDLAPKNLTAKK